jgi:hypothetical protein
MMLAEANSGTDMATTRVEDLCMQMNVGQTSGVATNEMDLPLDVSNKLKQLFGRDLTRLYHAQDALVNEEAKRRDDIDTTSVEIIDVSAKLSDEDLQAELLLFLKPETSDSMPWLRGRWDATAEGKDRGKEPLVFQMISENGETIGAISGTTLLSPGRRNCSG